jgi:hypothetical protein
VQTLVPTAKQVKSTHAALETKVDVPFEAGLLAFNDVSRTMENFAIKEEDDLKIAHAKSQVCFGLRSFLRQGNDGLVSCRISLRNYSRSSSRHIHDVIRFAWNSTKP